MINAQIIDKIRQIVRFYETSKISGANYGAIALLHDGPDNHVQITYGSTQTTEYGNLRVLLGNYANANGRYSEQMRPWINRIGDHSQPSLATNTIFIQLLKDASTDVVMHLIQDKFFVEHYFSPAQNWFTPAGLTLPLSLLVIYDSYVQSGSMMDWLVAKVSEKLPKLGGQEKTWITQYATARGNWLRTSVNHPALHATEYRTDSFLNAIAKDNWALDQPYMVGRYNLEFFQLQATIA